MRTPYLGPGLCVDSDGVIPVLGSSQESGLVRTDCHIYSNSKMNRRNFRYRDDIVFRRIVKITVILLQVTGYPNLILTFRYYTRRSDHGDGSKGISTGVSSETKSIGKNVIW